MKEENKIITEDLIISRLKERKVLDRYDLNEALAISQMQEYYSLELTDVYNSRAHDVSFYEESTADGYSVWVVKYGNSQINICEDVYFYDSDLADKLCEVISNGYGLIYIDDFYQSWVYEALDSVYNDYISDMREVIEDELINEGYELED